MSDRRKFIKDTCSLCAGALGLGILLSEESCKPTSAVFTSEANKESVSIPLRLFKDNKTLVVNNPAMENTILLVKKGENDFIALLMKCTHKGASLDAMPDKLYCPAHGSMFDFDGNVTKSPAARPLVKFPAIVERDHVVINVGNGS